MLLSHDIKNSTLVGLSITCSQRGRSWKTVSRVSQLLLVGWSCNNNDNYFMAHFLHGKNIMFAQNSEENISIKMHFLRVRLCTPQILCGIVTYRWHIYFHRHLVLVGLIIIYTFLEVLISPKNSYFLYIISILFSELVHWNNTI